MLAYRYSAEVRNAGAPTSSGQDGGVTTYTLGLASNGPASIFGAEGMIVATPPELLPLTSNVIGTISNSSRGISAL